ncbi:hypothetical protein [Alkalihalobacillus sp. BA299]|uniref:hypothetical protein n=1 Tax=Alkalihalobacillus sp. BA299 TaxID=2815938 RepID=UPI001AD97354|nr:hypothetical protein [Alkalihalobacillus sp. BA299]
MNRKHTDQVQQYKQQEDEWNKYILSTFNSHHFVYQTGKWINAHIDEVIEKRKIAELWLEILYVPTKNDIANLANKVIKHEDRVDFLEDQLFSLNKERRKTIEVLKRTNSEITLLKNFLESEVKQENPKTELALLKEELVGLIVGL